MWRSNGSIPSSLCMAELLTLSLRLSPAPLWRKPVLATWISDLILYHFPKTFCAVFDLNYTCRCPWIWKHNLLCEDSLLCQWGLGSRCESSPSLLWSRGLLGAQIQPAMCDWLTSTWRHVALVKSMLTYRPSTLHPCKDNGAGVPQDIAVYMLSWLTWLNNGYMEKSLTPLSSEGTTEKNKSQILFLFSLHGS